MTLSSKIKLGGISDNQLNSNKNSKKSNIPLGIISFEFFYNFGLATKIIMYNLISYK
jgi:hypothetical protein